MATQIYNVLEIIQYLTVSSIPEQVRGQIGDDLPKYVIIWDNVSFHRSNIIRQWFAAHNRMLMEFLSPYSPFLNPIEECFSA